MEFSPINTASKEVDIIKNEVNSSYKNTINDFAKTIIDNTTKVDLSLPPQDFKPDTGQYFEGYEAPKQKATLESRYYDIEQAYGDIGGGKSIRLYDTFKRGRDNAEYAAANQTTGEKWANGVEKALLKTGNAVLGGTAGIVYGLGAWAAEGSLSALYDNDFSNTLSDWDTKLNYQLPNYYTKQESEKGIFGQAATANFWADKVLGGLSFTAGAIISEGIWAAATGGTSLAVSAARWGARFGRGAVDVAKTGRWTVEALGETGALTALAKNKSFLKQAIQTSFDANKINIKLATNLGRAVDVLNTARFTATSAGFESSVEALQYKKEATENFYNTFYDKNGREPDAEDIATFDENLRNSANAVFGVNMAIVGSSNLITMGKLFELKNPIKTGMTEFIEKKAFGYGVKKTGDGAYKVLEATKAQKIARNIFAYGKAPVTEGLYEEGFQGVTTKTANKWIDHTYSDKNTAQTFSTMGAVYESLSEQYGTKEGWVENGVGMIIGALGGSVNTRAQMKAKDTELAFKAKGIETFSPEKGLLVQSLLTRKVMMSNQITGFSEEAKIEAESGNVVKSDIAGEGVIHAFLNHKYYLNESFEDAAKEVKTTLDTITLEQFKNAGIEEKDIDNYKENTLNEFIDKSKSFKKNRKFAEYIIGKNPSVGEQEIKSILGESFKGVNTNQALIESLTWVLTEGETAGKFINDIQSKISDEVGAEHRTTIELISSLNRLKGYDEASRLSIISSHQNLTRERDKIQKEIAELNARPKETEGDRVRGKTLEDKNLRLLDLNNNIAELDGKLNGIADKLNKQESYRKDVSDLRFNQDVSGTTITARDLLNLNENVDKFKSLIESLKVSDPQRGTYLSDLMDEYAQAEDIFLTSQRTFDMLSSGEMKLSKVNTWLGKKMFKNKSMDEATKDWLTDALNKYEKNVLSVMGGVSNDEVSAPKTKEELVNRKEELEAIPEEERTDEEDKELSDIEENLKEEVKQNRNIVPQSDNTSIETSKSPIEDYKNRIEKMLSKGYYSLERIGKNYEDLKDLEPTQAEIEEYRNLDEGERYNELGKKLSDWKLLDSATDGEGNSIADLVKLIKQHEKPVEESDVKTFLSDTDIDFLQEGSGDIVVNGLLQNILGHVKVKKLDTGKYRFTHLQLSKLIDRLTTDEINPTVKGVVVSSEEIDALKPGAVVTILNTEFTLGESGRIEVDIDKFRSIKQALGFELLDSGTNWSYKDVYEFNGVTWTKVESQYEDSTFEQSTSYELQKDDVVSFEIGNENGYNLELYNAWLNAKNSLEKSEARDKTKLVKALEEAQKAFKNGITIYAVDNKGRRISLLKALRSGVAEETFLQLRQRAFDNFNPELDKIDLKVTTKVANVYLGSPQLIIFDGKVQDIPFTKEAITQVISTGYIQDGEVTTSTPFPKGVDTSFIAKISKKDVGKKVPFIVIKKGVHNIAYPVTIVKIEEPKTSELSNAISNKDEKQQILAINDLIQKYKIDTELLVYGDLENNSKIEEVKSAFENHKSSVSMEDFASNKYDKNNLLKDVTINIDIEDDSSISDPKVIISLESEDMYFEEKLEVLEAKEISTIAKISKLADELYDELFVYQSTPIMHENRFIDIILDGYTPESEKVKQFPETIFPNRVAATQGDVGGDYRADAFTAYQRGFNILKEAFNSLTRLDVNGKEVSTLTKEGGKIVDKKTINRISNLFKIYDRNKKDMEILKKDKNSAKKNSECPK